MAVSRLLYDALDKIDDDEDFKMCKWYLSHGALEGIPPIRSRRLKKADRMDTVDELIQTYGEQTAVEIILTVLREMRFNAAAEALEEAYPEAEEGNAASSTTNSSAIDTESMDSDIDLK